MKRTKLNTIIRSRKSLHLFQLRPRLPGIPALLKLRLGLTGRFAFGLIPRDQRPLRTAAAEESRAAAVALADNADPIKTTRPLSARYDGADSPVARRRSDDGLRFRSSLHPRSICIGETGFLGPETYRPKSPSGQKRSPRRPKRSRNSPPIAGSLAVSGKSAGSKDCVVDPRGLELRARHPVRDKLPK